MDSHRTLRMVAMLVPLGLLLGACGGAATGYGPAPTPSATAAPATSATAAPTTAASPAPATEVTLGAGWVVSSTSKATVSVREQLVGVSLPSDAVLVATGAAGSFQLKDDGSFSGDSKISFDLTTLSSDQRDRDNFVKQDTLATRQFPKAELVPTKASGLTLPLPATGEFTFKLTGTMTVRGKPKEVTFDVLAKRSGADLTVAATASPSLKFGDFGMSAPAVPFRVVSVVDEIRLVVNLVATGPKG